MTGGGSERSQKFSSLQNGVIGSLAGIIEVSIQQPAVTIKNTVQQHRAITWTIPALYRGVGINIASIAPIAGLQFAANGKLLRLLNKKTDEKKPTSDATRITCGALAGLCSGLLSSPAELVMIQQQNLGKAFFPTVLSISKLYGPTRLYRALPLTSCREAVWCAGFLALGPVVTENLHDVVPSVFGTHELSSLSQKASASMVGSIIAGLVTVYATQPIDTVKTVMQGQANNPGKLDNAWQVSRNLYSQRGFTGFYRGSIARGGRLIGAVFILGQARLFLEEVFDEYNILATS